jgi:hypothetical protein
MLIGQSRGESTVTIAFSRALWTGVGDPPRVEVRIVVQ